MRKQRIHAGLRRRRIENIFHFAILLCDGVSALHHHAIELRAVVRNAESKRQVIAHIGQRSCQQHIQYRDEDDALQIFRNNLRRYIQ